MFPLYDENPSLSTPLATGGLIAANLLVWALVQGLGSEPLLTKSVCELGLVPGELLQRVPPGSALAVGRGIACVTTAAPSWYTPLSSMFLHGGWMHLIGNLWFLWIFGNNVEDAMGHARFLAFYLLCGLAAAALQVASQPESIVPMVGASGAIGGVMGGYIVLYPQVRIQTAVMLGFYVTRVAVPALWMLGYWFLLQLVGGAFAPGEGGGVAFWAHVGGFAAGAALVGLFRDPERLRRRVADGFYRRV